MLSYLVGGQTRGQGSPAVLMQPWAAERTAYQFEVREMALAHNVGSAVERSYQRSDLFERRRALMDDWAKFCNHAATGDVVPLRSSPGDLGQGKQRSSKWRSIRLP